MLLKQLVEFNKDFFILLILSNALNQLKTTIFSDCLIKFTLIFPIIIEI